MYAEMPEKYYATKAIHWGGYEVWNRSVMAVDFALHPLRTCPRVVVMYLLGAAP